MCICCQKDWLECIKNPRILKLIILTRLNGSSANKKKVHGKRGKMHVYVYIVLDLCLFGTSLLLLSHNFAFTALRSCWLKEKLLPKCNLNPILLLLARISPSLSISLTLEDIHKSWRCKLSRDCNSTYNFELIANVFLKFE